MKRCLALVALIVVLVGTTVGWAQGTITVAPGESLQVAIDRAPNGAVIELTPGNWTENIVIDKSITIRSATTFPDEPCHILVFQSSGIANLAADQQHEALSRIAQVFQNRVTLYGLTNVEIMPAGTDKVVITFPQEINPQPVIDLLGRVGQLEFRKVVASGVDPDKLKAEQTSSQEVLPDQQKDEYFLVDAPLITGADIAGARVQTMSFVTLSHTERPYIAISFTEAGAKKFAAAINALKIHDRLAIVLDGVVYTAPEITQSIKDAAAHGWQAIQNTTSIQGMFTHDEATQIAAAIQSGALPYPVRVSDELSSPTTRAVIHQNGTSPAVQIGTSASVIHVVMNEIHVIGAISASGQAEVELTDCSVLESSGITLSAAAYAMIDGCTIADNDIGISLADNAHAIIKNCDITGNSTGVLVADKAVATLIGNKITHNALGLALFDLTCTDTGRAFRGYVTGHDNTIPGLNDPDGNKIAVCPTDLAFLTTSVGGVLDRRH